MLIIPNSISNTCLQKLISHIKGYIPVEFINDKASVIKHVNEFLLSISYIFSGANTYTQQNWMERGRRLYAFSLLYIDLIMFADCKSEVVLSNNFTKYMCTPNATNLIPMRHLYKVLTTIALLYLHECLYFYLYDDDNKGKNRQDLLQEQIYAHMYNAKLRFSKTDTLTCINNLETKNIEIVRTINQYLITSLELRKHYLDFCKTHLHVKADKSHEMFDDKLDGLIQAVTSLMNKSNLYI